MWCQMSFLLPLHSVDAFGRTTATSACAMIIERQAYTQPIHWAAPASLLHISTTPPPRPCSTRFSIYQTWLIVWGINLTSFKYSVLGLSDGGGRKGRGLPWAGGKLSVPVNRRIHSCNCWSLWYTITVVFALYSVNVLWQVYCFLQVWYHSI